MKLQDLKRLETIADDTVETIPIRLIPPGDNGDSCGNLTVAKANNCFDIQISNGGGTCFITVPSIDLSSAKESISICLSKSIPWYTKKQLIEIIEQHNKQKKQKKWTELEEKHGITK